MISKNTIDLIFETVKIEDIVSDYVSLRKRGSNLIGLCPFHGEKTPSFVVSPAKDIYKCFGCGEAGNAVNFVMNHDQLSYPEALRQIAQKYNIEIEETVSSAEENEERAKQDVMHQISQLAMEHFQNNLLNTDLGKSIGASYFKSRGFSQHIIDKFGLGFSLNSGEFSKLATQSGYNKEQLDNSGLTKNGRDFFRNRVMFTIHNLSGKPIAFAGRILDKNAKAPKYINSPETEIYNKSKTLYGISLARRAIHKNDSCILVEGYTDVISMHIAGFENVVASSGTSLTEGQIKVIKRFTNNITLLYDGDKAGIKAAIRGMDMILEQDMNVKIVLLPDNADPDSFVQQHGVDKMAEQLNEKAKDIVLFKTDLLLEESKNDPIKKAEVTREILSSIAKVPDTIKRSFYIKSCSEKMDINEETLVYEINKIIGKNYKEKQKKENRASYQSNNEVKEAVSQSSPPPKANTQSTPNSSIQAIQEKDIASLLILFGNEPTLEDENTTISEYVLSDLEDIIEEMEHPIYGEVIKDYYQNALNDNTINSKYFSTHPNDSIRKFAIDILSENYEFSPNWSKRFGIELTTQKMPELNYNKVMEKSLLHFKLAKIIEMMIKIDGELQTCEPSQWEEKIVIKMKLNTMKLEIAKKLGTVIR